VCPWVGAFRGRPCRSWLGSPRRGWARRRAGAAHQQIYAIEAASKEAGEGPRTSACGGGTDDGQGAVLGPQRFCVIAKRLERGTFHLPRGMHAEWWRWIGPS
jgi:hypothetical protein